MQAQSADDPACPRRALDCVAEDLTLGRSNREEMRSLLDLLEIRGPARPHLQTARPPRAARLGDRPRRPGGLFGPARRRRTVATGRGRPPRRARRGPRLAQLFGGNTGPDRRRGGLGRRAGPLGSRGARLCGARRGWAYGRELPGPSGRGPAGGGRPPARGGLSGREARRRAGARRSLASVLGLSADRTRRIVAHRAKELMRALEPQGIRFTGLDLDTAVAAYLLDAREGQASLCGTGRSRADPRHGRPCHRRGHRFSSSSASTSRAAKVPERRRRRCLRDADEGGGTGGHAGAPRPGDREGPGGDRRHPALRGRGTSLDPCAREDGGRRHRR